MHMLGYKDFRSRPSIVLNMGAIDKKRKDSTASVQQYEKNGAVNAAKCYTSAALASAAVTR